MGALTVLYLILPFPLAFILHDAEEAAVQRRWMSEHGSSLIERFPKMATAIARLGALTTKGFIVAALEELVIIVLATLYVLVDGPFCVKIWSALFIAFSLHLLVHIVQAIAVRGYVPGLVTSVLLLPYAYLGMSSIWNMLSLVELVLYGLAGVAVMVLNLRFAHWLGRKIR